MEYGKNIKKILIELGISQTEMAEKIGISRQQLNNIINDRGKFTTEQIHNLYKLYDINLNYLYTGEGKMFNNENKSSVYAQTDIDEHYAANKPDDTPILTHREKEIFELMLNGCSNMKIAESICISHHTVKAHISSILRKLRVNSRVEAVVAYRKIMK